MNHYYTSTGEKISKSKIDANIRKAKAELIEQQFDEYGYNFCQRCGRNDCKPLDCSHNISVDECQKTGRSELAWDKINMEIIGRKCHQIKDGLDLKFNKS